MGNFVIDLDDMEALRGIAKRLDALGNRISDVADSSAASLQRIVNLEQQVANQALQIHDLKNPKDVPTQSPEVLKSQAAATQATEHLYAPLRSDTKPLLEMSAFVRRVAGMSAEDFGWLAVAELIADAQDILKRST